MSDHEVDIAGYGVVRICSQPVDRLVDRLSSPALAQVCDELARLRTSWRGHAPRVAEELTDVVPLIEDRGERRAVLALRRRLHRAVDVPAADMGFLLDLQATSSLSGLAELGSLAHRIADLSKLLASEYDTALASEQAVLAEATRSRSLRAGAQLSSSGLLHNMDRYAASVGEGAAHGKRARVTESTLTNLVTRSHLKPSPFGRLVHTRPVVISGVSTPLPRTDEEPTSVCRLPRQLVNWVERCLADHPSLSSAALLRRAPLVGRSAKGVTFLVRGRDGTSNGSHKEDFVRFPESPVVTRILAVAAEAPVPETELRREWKGDETAQEELDTLLERGVLARDLGVGDQHPHPIVRLIDLLSDGCDPELRSCVEDLAAVEAAFATAPVEERGDLIARIRLRVGDLARACSVPDPPLDSARTLIYEDAVDPGTVFEEEEIWRRHLPTLARWHHVLPIFDDGAHVRAGVADVIRETFGPGPHRLLPLYAALSSPRLQSVLLQRLTDVSAPVPKMLRELQDRVFDLAVDDGSDTEAVIDPERVAEIAENLPPWISPWPRVSWNVQHHGEGGTDNLVVNGSSIGFGRAVSRFLPTFASAGAPDFTDLVRKDVGRNDRPTEPLTDLYAVLGINANVHSPTLGRHVSYPCSCPEDWGEAMGVDLEDCWAEVGPSGLVLREGREGPPLRLVMLNFLLNELAPRFYQFLGFFGVGGLANMTWWERVDQRRGVVDRIREYPRVRSGSLILDRRTWKVPFDRLPDLDGADDVEAFARVREWRERTGLPDRVFYRSFTLPDPLVPRSEGERDGWARTLNAFPTSSERKPTFLDFTSTTSVRAWRRLLRRRRGDMTFQECVPEVDSGAPAREFLIETAEVDR